MALEQVTFRAPHPHGLPADRYSHFIRPLGKGTFGEVYLCCLRTAIPQHPPAQLRQHCQYHTRNAGASDASLAGNGTCGNCAAYGYDGNNGQPLADQQPPQLYDYQWIAVKLSKPLQEYSRQTLEYLKREVVWQRRLNHMHVIGFREVGTTAHHRLYIALEFADSGNLRQWLDARGGRLPESDARWFFQQLVYGLSYCHAYGVYNRDIKPENLLLHRSGLELPLLKVADFGLCKSSNDSLPNSCVGSPNYMAPEVFMQTAHDGARPVGVPAYDGKKADVFSCGVVLYRMVFGCLPFNRTPDGQPLHPTRDLRQIVANMRAERWQQLLPQQPTRPQAQSPAAGPCSAGAAAGAAAGTCGGPSASLLDLLAGMLCCNPEARLSLAQVKRHDWYRRGLTDEIYQMLLSSDTVTANGELQDAAGQGLDSDMQSVELIEQQFDAVLAAYDRSRREAARQASEEEAEEGDHWDVGAGGRGEVS